MEYSEIIQTLLLCALLGIALGIAIVVRGVRILVNLFNPATWKIYGFEKDNVPKFIKLMSVRVVGYMAIRYVLKRIK